jgi:DNA-binding transcriptional MerR regulator
MKVGELARRTGLSVRTLHFYDEIGLLPPTARSDSGHRLYGPAAAVRLQQIRSLRQLGLSLTQVVEVLNRPECVPRRVIEMHLARLRSRIKLQQALCDRLEAIARRLSAAEEVSVDEFLETIEVMTMVEKYFTPGQMEQIKQRRGVVGEQRIGEVEAEWPRLIADVRTAMDQGAAPESPRVQALARRWTGLLREFTGGDAGIEKSLATMYAREPAMGRSVGIDPAMFEYVGKAIAASRRPSQTAPRDPSA